MYNTTANDNVAVPDVTTNENSFDNEFKFPLSLFHFQDEMETNQFA